MIKKASLTALPQNSLTTKLTWNLNKLTYKLDKLATEKMPKEILLWIDLKTNKAQDAVSA